MTKTYDFNDQAMTIVVNQCDEEAVTAHLRAGGISLCRETELPGTGRVRPGVSLQLQGDPTPTEVRSCLSSWKERSTSRLIKDFAKALGQKKSNPRKGA